MLVSEHSQIAMLAMGALQVPCAACVLPLPGHAWGVKISAVWGKGKAHDGDEGLGLALCAAQDIEQLLHAHGLHSAGPHQVLHNLYKLLAAAASAVPSGSSGRAASM